MAIEFREWPKIARLNRDIVITEKIDGTNAAVVIEETDALADNTVLGRDGTTYRVGAQSRNLLITPEDDHYGFAGWVSDNAESLIEVLGVGHHFGEWWGAGVGRGYGLPKGERRFSLFNTKRWADLFGASPLPGLSSVPVLWQGSFSQAMIDFQVKMLRLDGSIAAPGFYRPEGIVVYHTAANQMFKVTLENDEAPKSLAA